VEVAVEGKWWRDVKINEGANYGDGSEC